MLFSSFSFLFGYLPAVLLLYFALPPLAARAGLRSPGKLLALRNAVLLIVSLIFYGFGEPVYVFLMIGTILADFLFGLFLPRVRHPKALLVLAILFNVGLLFFFKYAAFFFGMFGISLRVPRLPLGISFYTFQALSYVADVYFGEVAPERNPIRFGTYVALFPQLIAGPIVRYRDIADELSRRQHTLAGAASGASLFVVGLAKKVLLANPAGALFAAFTADGVSSVSFVGAWLALLGFTFQIYFDFSGYSDMAVGLGRIFGFSFPRNFRYPYIALSVTDFWRRWHMTLSDFFRCYVYIPLGGNRKGVFRTIFNLLIVWLLTGLWHGAAWNFVLWGLYYFFLLLSEKFVLSRFLARLPAFIRRVLTFAAILFGWMLFAFDSSRTGLSFGALSRFLPSLFGANGAASGNDLYELTRHIPFLIILFIGATPLPHAAFTRLCKGRGGAALRVVLTLAGFVLSVSYLAQAGYNPFLYFRF